MNNTKKILNLLREVYPISWKKTTIETDDPFNEEMEIHTSDCGEFLIKRYENWDDEETSFVIELDYFKYHPNDDWIDVVEFETLDEAMEWCSFLKYKYDKKIKGEGSK